MNLNQKTVAEVATILKVDATKLAEHLTTDVADVSKQETKVKELVPNGKFLTESEETQLLDNHGKTKYDSGRHVEREQTLKEAKKKFGFDPVDPSINSLDILVSKIVEQEKTKLGQQPDKRVTDLETEKTNLQKTVTELTNELTGWKDKVSQAETNAVVKSSILSAVSAVPIDADEAKLPIQREILQTAFERKHEVKMEEGKQVVYREGKKLVDSLQNPLSVADVMKDFAPTYISVKKVAGRGDSSSQHSQLTGDLAAITNKESFVKYLEAKNIRMDSQEMLAVLKEVRAKNPAFKLN